MGVFAANFNSVYKIICIYFIFSDIKLLVWLFALCVCVCVCVMHQVSILPAYLALYYFIFSYTASKHWDFMKLKPMDLWI